MYAGELEEVAEVERFLHRVHAKGGRVVVGPRYSGTLVAVRATALQLGITLVSPSSGIATLPSPRGNVLRLWPSDRNEARVLAHVIPEVADTVVVLAHDDDAGRALQVPRRPDLSQTVDSRSPFEWWYWIPQFFATFVPPPTDISFIHHNTL